MVASLRAGQPERKIAEAEVLPEPIVREIRRLALEAELRHRAAMRLAFTECIETISQLTREIEESIHEELVTSRVA